MFGKLTGLVDSIDKDSIIIDVNGCGYIVFCSNILLNHAKIGEKISLLIETIVREDGWSLYGFKDKEEKLWFKKLISVKGVGAKLAINVLSSMNSERIHMAIISQDKLAFSNIPGVGKKIVERILIELKDAAAKLDMPQNIEDVKIDSKTDSLKRDLLSALTNLGYNRNEAYFVSLKLIKENPDSNFSDLVKFALKELAKK